MWGIGHAPSNECEPRVEAVMSEVRMTNGNQSMARYAILEDDNPADDGNLSAANGKAEGKRPAKLLFGATKGEPKFLSKRSRQADVEPDHERKPRSLAPTPRKIFVQKGGDE